MLTELRTGIATALKDAGMRAFEYVGEAVTPPCAVVIPAEPYIQTRSADQTLPFRKVFVGIDVLLLTNRDVSAKEAAADADQQIEQAMAALDDYRITSVSRPGVVTLSGSKYVGSVLSIQEMTEEP